MHLQGLHYGSSTTQLCNRPECPAGDHVSPFGSRGRRAVGKDQRRYRQRMMCSANELKRMVGGLHKGFTACAGNWTLLVVSQCCPA